MNSKDTLLNIIKAYLNNTDINIDCDFDDLYELCNILNVSSIVGQYLNDHNIHNNNFDKCIYKAIISYEKYNNIKKEINNTLNNKYEYLYLKGISVADKYPIPYLRYSGDIDIITKQYDEVKDILINTLNFKLKSSSIQETSLKRKDLNIDLHRTFYFDNNKYEEIFINTYNSNHELDNNYLYIFEILHSLKHFFVGVLELRLFIDLYYLRNNIDIELVNKILKEYKLDKYNNALNSYLDALIGNKEYSDNDLLIQDYIFDYCNDLGASNRILVNQYNNNKYTYLLSKIFPKYEIMRYEYPILNKYKILLPIYYIYRNINKLLSNRGKYGLNMIKNNNNIDNNKLNKINEFIRGLDL